MTDDDDRIDASEGVEILEQSDCHRDLIRYVKRAKARGGTPLLHSMQYQLNYVSVEKWATRGTQIEEQLYRNGAQGALSCGNLDVMNTNICEQIMADYHQ